MGDAGAHEFDAVLVLRTSAPRITIRRYRHGDAGRLAHEADEPRVAAHLRDGFPSPYTPRDAQEWILTATSAPGLELAAIALDDEVVGGIGMLRGVDVYRFSAEIGYWLGIAHWGRGYATAAVRAYCDHLFATTRLHRLEATVFAGNDASGRVLEKCGFRGEGVRRGVVCKGGVFLDAVTYARLRDEAPRQGVVGPPG